MTQQEIADSLDTTRASIANLLSVNGDNLSMNLIRKIIAKYPDLNIDWLLVGRGDMLIPGHGLQKEYEIKQIVSELVKEEIQNYIKHQKNKK